MTIQQLKYVITVADYKSMNKAANQLFISQPSLSEAVRSLEKETGTTIFLRTNRGISITPEGEEFLSYARQVVAQYHLMEEHYIEKKEIKKRFAVSMQHYSFAVKAFVETVKEFGMEEYEFALREVRTHEVIDDVSNFRSELGIIYVNDFNRQVLEKIFRDKEVEFHSLFACKTYVYMWRGNPLAQKKKLRLEDLSEYPCMSFEQGENNSFYFAEEVLSTYQYKRMIKVNDRATMLNLMVGLNGYTMCSGIICEELNGDDYVAIPLDYREEMNIGYIHHKNMRVSQLGNKYIEELMKYKELVME